MNTALHLQYLTDESGTRTSVMVPLSEWEALMEDLSDLASLAERRNDPGISHREVVAELKRDGLL